MAASRAVVDAKAAGADAVYGVNTGFGNFAETRIDQADLAALQLNLLRSHAAGVDEPLPVRAVRAAMALRANVLAKGYSGIRVETLEALLALLNRRVHPRVPSRGSVGASGDLAPLAHLALVLVGEGETWDDGARVPGAEALSAAGLDAGHAGAERRAGPDQRHAGVDRGAGAGAGRRRAAEPRRRYRRRAVDRRPDGVDASVRCPHSRGASVCGTRRRRRATCCG